MKGFISRNELLRNLPDSIVYRLRDYQDEIPEYLIVDAIIPLDTSGVDTEEEDKDIREILAYKEWRIFLMLRESPDYVSSQKLMDEMGITRENTVCQHIKNIRRKQKKYEIKNKSGFGYRLV